MLLRLAYGDETYARDLGAIESSALIRAYAKQLLLALVLYVVCAKFCALIDLVSASNLVPADRTVLKNALVELRNHVAVAAVPEYETFVRTLICQISKAIGLFRDANQPNPGQYYPIGILPLHQIASDPAVAASSGSRELALALGLLAVGHDRGLWSLILSDAALPAAGALSISIAGRTTRVFFVANSDVAVSLILHGHVDEDEPDAILICSNALASRAHLSPRAKRGRTGTASLREVGMPDVLNSTDGLDDLLRGFHEELAL
jgi:hypothetical protein